MEAWENYFEVMEKVVAQVKNTQKDNIKKLLSAKKKAA